MSSQLGQALTRVVYGARQLPRITWYIGHSLVLRELIDAVGKREDPKVGGHVHTNAPAPGRKHIYADMAKLFLQDLANVEAGFYPIPADHDGSFLGLIHRSRMFFDDLPDVHQRRQQRGHNEVLNETARGRDPVITCRTSITNPAVG